jgi:hypothetical protein
VNCSIDFSVFVRIDIGILWTFLLICRFLLVHHAVVLFKCGIIYKRLSTLEGNMSMGYGLERDTGMSRPHLSLFSLSGCQEMDRPPLIHTTSMKCCVVTGPKQQIK